jgi:DNA-binding NtrC family response regulator
VLLIGPRDLADQFLGPLMPSLSSPVVYLDPANPTFHNHSGGTLIVRDVERLAPLHQDHFLAWLNAQHEITCTIATSPGSLFPRVQVGAFSERLYYRLNTVIVELDRR